MLILVGVSVNIALGNGLFKAAQSGAKNTELAKQQETELSSGQVTIGNKTYSSIESYVAGNAGMPAGVKVGDYISNYVPNYSDGRTYSYDGQIFTAEDLSWRILSIDETTGKVVLIADEATVSKLKITVFVSADGSPDIDIDYIGKLCASLYSSDEVGTARSANLNEIIPELINCSADYWIYKCEHEAYANPDNPLGPPNEDHWFYYVNTVGATEKVEAGMRWTGGKIT